MKRLLINDMFPGERRIALISDQQLVFFEYEHASDKRRKGNLYNAVVESIEESLEAAFVNYGTDKRGFLPFSAIADSDRTTSNKSVKSDGEKKTKKKTPVKLGQKLLVQVEHDERDNKGAALSTRLTLAGSYWVLSPNNPKAGGISRQISGAQREEMRDKLSQIDVPEGMGIIMRTAGIGRTVEELRWDLDCQLNLWQSIQKASEENVTPCLIYREDDALFRTIRDNLRHDIDEVVVDNEETFAFVRDFIKDSCPDFADKVTHYQSQVPLFTHYQIEEQINNLDERDVPLPSGGRLVFDKGEALTAIDVNSASTKGSDIEGTALQTNLEAADEVARQLRLRDIGGLVVIDFIDMTSKRNRDAVEKRLEKAVANDRARIQTTHISRLGLLEMSRQRITSAVGEQGLNDCPHCSGRGSIRSVELFSSTMLRTIEEQAIHTQSITLQVQLPLAVATYILNEKRDIVKAIETRQQASIMIIPNPHFDIPKFQIKRIRHQAEGKKQASSYEATYNTEPESVELNTTTWHNPAAEQPAVQRQHGRQYPGKKTTKPGLIKRLWSSIQTDEVEEETPAAKTPRTNRTRNTDNRNNRRNTSSTRTGGRNGGNRQNQSRSSSTSNGNRGPRNDRTATQSRRRPSRDSQRSRKAYDDDNVGNRIEDTAIEHIDDDIGNRIDAPTKKSASPQRNRRGNQPRGRSSDRSNTQRGNRRQTSSGNRQRRDNGNSAPLSDIVHDDLESL